MSPVHRLQGTEIYLSSLNVKVIVMKGLPSATYWKHGAMFTDKFVYPTSFGY